MTDDEGLPTMYDVKGILPRDTAQDATRYASLDDWLNEPEGFGPRIERLPDSAYSWVKTAWELGAASRSPAAIAPAVWNDGYQAEAMKLASEIRSRRHEDFTPEYQEKLLLADALMQALGVVESLTTALRFYADSRRYDGPNMPPISDDPYSPEGMAYRWDVTRDFGRIASRAISSTVQHPPQDRSPE